MHLVQMPHTNFFKRYYLIRSDGTDRNILLDIQNWQEEDKKVSLNQKSDND